MALTFSLVATWDDGKRVQVSRTIVACKLHDLACQLR